MPRSSFNNGWTVRPKVGIFNEPPAGRSVDQQVGSSSLFGRTLLSPESEPMGVEYAPPDASTKPRSP